MSTLLLGLTWWMRRAERRFLKALDSSTGERSRRGVKVEIKVRDELGRSSSRQVDARAARDALTLKGCQFVYNQAVYTSTTAAPASLIPPLSRRSGAPILQSRTALQLPSDSPRLPPPPQHLPAALISTSQPATALQSPPWRGPTHFECWRRGERPSR